MNARIFRLVFDRLRNTLVPVSEVAQANTVSSATRGQRRSVNRAGVKRAAQAGTVSAMLAMGLSYSAPAVSNDPLPVPAADFVSSGAATQAVTGTTMTINQASDRAILNWQSFNIDANHLVQFNQPGASSIALNRIGSADPSIIAGALQANGQIYLFNQNGILFAQGAQINVGGLVATTLNITDEVFQKGILSITDGSAAFAWQGSASQFGTSFIRLDPGANIRTADGGRVMLFAPRIENAGRIETPGGQAILAAGARVYLEASSDARLRGLLVEVDPLSATQGGTVTNQSIAGAVGEIIARRGNVTLMGLAVNQQGRITATSSVSANGSVYLLARDTTTPRVTSGDPRTDRVATRAGTLVVSSGSVTEVLPDLASGETSVDAQTFNPSQIVAQANKIHLQSSSVVRATGGDISITALRDPSNPLTSAGGAPANGSRIFMDTGAIVDASGSRGVEIAVERNIVTAELRGNELRDAPVQRGGILQGRKVLVDARVGTSLADVSGYLAQIRRGVGERTAGGGTVTFLSEGDVVIREGALIDVSGGSLQWLAGATGTTKLVSNGRLYDIGDASPDLVYQSVFDSAPQAEAGYAEGKDAGTVRLSARAVVLDGTLRGEAITGARQTDAAMAPLGGQLVLGDATGGSSGQDLRLPTITATSGVGSLSAQFLADPLNAALGDRAQRVSVALAAVLGNGFNRIGLYSNDVVELPLDMTLRPGGSFTASARRVELTGNLGVAAGAITLESRATQSAGPGGVVVGAGRTVSTAATWVNDWLDTAGGAERRTAWIDGGSITIRSNTSIAIRSGAVLDASGGARLRTDRTVEYGEAGSIALATNVGSTNITSQLELGGSLRAFGFARGGSVELAVPSVRIGGTPGAGELGLTAGFFDQGGFADFTIDAVTGMTVASGTLVSPRVSNFVLRSDFASRASGTAVVDVATLALLPEEFRQPASITLNASDIVQGRTVLEEGASITTDPGGSVTLGAGAQLTVLGSITAPAGTIALSITSKPGQSLDPGFLDDQTLWIGARSRLSTRGAANVITNARGWRDGEVLDGGTISAVAGRGYVVVEEGAVLDVRGAAAELDIVTPGAVGLLYQPRTVYSDAGGIVLESREGVLFDGTVLAAPGGATAGGGSFDLRLDRREALIVDVGSAYPLTDRRIEIRATGLAVPVGLKPGDVIDRAANNGVARVSMDRLRDSGLDDIRLTSENRIRVVGDVTVAAGRSVTLDAPILEASAGANAIVAAPYVAIGNFNPVYQGAKVGSGGTATFLAKGNLIDVVGAIGLQGFGDVSFESATDIRLRGVLDNTPTASRLIGSITGGGELSMTAQQVYPTTLSEFTIDYAGAATPGGAVRFFRSAGSASTPLSAGGALTVKAATIEQSGVVRAPIGSITLEANDLQLKAGSETSVSAAGLLIPFGKVENAKDWIYDFRNRVAKIFDRPPEKAITLSGTSVDVAEGARLDLAGGGDLFAYEFVPGLGGSADYLAKPGVYAVVPGLTSPYAPFDYQYSTISDLKVGDSITLGAGGGLAAGTYTLLPGHYALLPGAFAITLVDGYQDIGPSQTIALASGGAIVSGTRFDVDSGARDQRSAGYLVESAGLVRERAQYDGFTAGTFFRSAAERDGVTVPRLPGDAGRLVTAATSTLALDGIVNLSAGVNGRGGLFDIVADKIAVVGDLATVPTGFLRVSAGDISRIGAESILLGGVRSQDARGSRVTARSTQVVVDNAGTPLVAGEILMVASDRVTFSTDSTVTASGNGVPYGSADRILLDGDSAFVRISTDTELRLDRSGAARVAGFVDVGSGVTFTGNAVELDGTLDTRIASDVVIDSRAVGLGASRVIFGPATAGGSGLAVDATLLGQLGAAQMLLFRGYDSIDFNEALALGEISAQGSPTLTRLVLDSPSLRGQGAAGTAVKLTAGTIELRNASGGVPGSPGAGLGTLELVAAATGGSGGRILVDAGTKSISGFASNSLTASREFLMQGNGSLAVAGNVALAAERLTATTAAVQSMTASGSLSVSSLGAVPSASSASGLGATLTLTGAEVAYGGVVDLPSGHLTLRATSGDVAVRTGSRIFAGGVTRTFDGVGVFTDGGSVSLVSDQGDVTLGAGAAIDVSAPAGGGDAGSIAIRAGDRVVMAAATATDPLAALRGSAGNGRGGRFSSYAGFSSYSGSGDGEGAAVMSLLEALSSGGFDDVGITVGRGNLRLESASTTTIQARRLSVSADDGSIDLLTSIDAFGVKDPRVSLWARDDLTLGTGVQVRARGTTDGANGGRIELGSANGWVRFGNGSGLDVSGGTGGTGGTVLLRVPRTNGGAGNDVQLETGNATATGATDVIVEALRTYAGVSTISYGSGSGVLSIDAVTADVDTFMAGAAAIRQTHAGLVTRVRPGVEIRSTGNLTLAAPWDLYSPDRAGGEPGYLTLRAAGDLLLNGSLSDGFDGSGLLQAGRSWGYRLVGGADLAAADPMRTQFANGSSGDVVLATGVIVRTGTGAIDVAARRDFKLTSATSVLYTAGRQSDALPDFTAPESAGYPIDGGRLSIVAGRDVIGVATTQLITNWNFRQGTTTTDPVTGLPVFETDTNSTWYIRFDRFRQNVGALGGGDVSVTAGRDIQDLSVMLPTTGRISGNAPQQPSDDNLVVLGGGDLDVRAGRDIAGGQYYVARGEGALRAGGSLTLGTPAVPGIPALYPIIAQADSRFDVRALGHLNIETVLNPTVSSLPPASYFDEAFYRAYYFTYTDTAAVQMQSIAGDVVLHARTSEISRVTDAGPVGDRFVFSGALEQAAIAVFPGSLEVAALNGNVSVERAISLFPSARGALEVFAAGNIVTSGLLNMSDYDPALLPRPSAPTPDITQAMRVLNTSPLSSVAHGLSLLHAGDPRPSRLVTLTGDIVGGVTGIGAVSAKSARVIAGRDIVDFYIAAQNLSTSDVTLVQAGRDVRYSVARSQGANQLINNLAQVVVGGPGRVDVLAGRDVDLGTSAGFVTIGNLGNPVLPETGAGLRVLAGTDTRLDVERFLTTFPGIGGTAGADLARQVRALLAQPGLTDAEAFAAFRTLPAEAQLGVATYVAGNEFYLRYLQPEGAVGITKSYRTEWVDFANAAGVDPDQPTLETVQAFRYHVLWPELRAAGRAAVAGGATPGDYSRGYDVLSLAGLGGAFVSNGDVNLIFSQLKTQRGGAIELLAPGGSANVGLATPPVGFSKGADSLGILSVRGGDINALVGNNFNVNQSRVFTLEGGNILVWSSEGDIDAGRGAKTAISVPPPVVRINSAGELVVEFPGAASGSGIGVLLTRADLVPGDVDLIAPTGTVNAGDAGIRAAGNLTIAAVRVVGADNIQVGGTSAGVPAQTSSIGAGVSGLGNVGAEGNKVAERTTQSMEKDSSSLNKKALMPSFITVEVLGIGEDDRDYQSEVKKCENLSPGDKQGCLSSVRKNRGQI